MGAARRSRRLPVTGEQVPVAGGRCLSLVTAAGPSMRLPFTGDCCLSLYPSCLPYYAAGRRSISTKMSWRPLYRV